MQVARLSVVPLILTLALAGCSDLLSVRDVRVELRTDKEVYSGDDQGYLTLTNVGKGRVELLAGHPVYGMKSRLQHRVDGEWQDYYFGIVGDVFLTIEYPFLWVVLDPGDSLTDHIIDHRVLIGADEGEYRYSVRVHDRSGAATTVYSPIFRVEAEPGADG